MTQHKTKTPNWARKNDFGVRKMSLKKLTSIAVVVLMSIASLWAQTRTAKLKNPDNTAGSAGASTTKTPATSIPVQNPEYVVGEGDVLHVDVWQETEVSHNVVVRPDGKISLPLINEIKVSGMTPLQIQGVIGEKLTTFVNQPKVTVTVMEIHSKRAFITGEVSRPGEYPLNTSVTVLQLIAEAGGFTPFAKTGNIVVLRVVNGAQQRIKFKYKEVVQGKNTQQNIALQPGDTVVVP